MTRFIDLLRTGLESAAEHEQATRQFPVLASQHHLHPWRPGDAIADRGLRLLIGAATWSGYDLRLLDLVAQALRLPRRDRLHIDVFNLSDCKTKEDFNRNVPDIGTVLQTPVVGVWDNGELKETATGKQARDLVARACGFDDATDVVQWLTSEWSSSNHPAAT